MGSLTGFPSWFSAGQGSNCCLSFIPHPTTPSPETVAALASLQLPTGHTLSPQEVEGLMEQMVQQVQETLNLEADVAQHLLAHSHWGAEQLLQRYSDDPEPVLLAAGLRVPQAQTASTRPDHCPVCISPLEPDDDLPCLCCMHYCCKVRLLLTQIFHLDAVPCGDKAWPRLTWRMSDKALSPLKFSPALILGWVNARV